MSALPHFRIMISLFLGLSFIAVSHAEAQISCSEVQNCSFENGLTNWVSSDVQAASFPLQVASSGAGWPPTLGLFTSQPTDGSSSLVHGFDGGGPGIIELAQDLVLPPGAPGTFLEFDYRAAWSLLFFATIDRTFEVQVQPSGGGTPLYSETVLTAIAGSVESDTGVQRGSVDLSAFSGMSVRIAFVWNIPEAFTGPAFFELDRIELQGVSTVQEGVSNLSCADDVATESLTASWDLPVSGAMSYNVYSDLAGSLVLVGNVPHPTNSFAVPYVLGVLGDFEICVEAVGATGTSDLVCCTTQIGTVPNDECPTAEALVFGTTMVDTTFATTSSPRLDSGCLGSSSTAIDCHQDLWFSFVGTGADVRVTSCGLAPGFRPRIAVYEGSCPAAPGAEHGCLEPGSSDCDDFLDVSTIPGQSYLVRVGGAAPTEFGIAEFAVVEKLVVTPPAALGCAPGIPITSAEISFVDGIPLPGEVLPREYLVERNGVPIATIPASGGPYLVTDSHVGQGTFLYSVRGLGEAFLESTPSSCSLTLGCDPVSIVTAGYDCLTDTVTLNWGANPDHIDFSIVREGLIGGVAVVATGLPTGTTSFIDVSPGEDLYTYSITAMCQSSGSTSTRSTLPISVQPPVIAGSSTDLILQLEKLTGGLTGSVDSGSALEAALATNGISSRRVRTARSFDEFVTAGCLDFTDFDRVWVLGGTFPADYRLSSAEGDALAAAAAAGVGVYFESGDHWAFEFVASGLDGRDGIDESLAIDGDEILTSLDGVNAPVACLFLGHLGSLSYTMDNQGADFNDRLAPANLTTVDTDIQSAEVIWQNHDDTMTGEDDFACAIIAVHNDSGVMISSSFEFGGIDPTQQGDIAARYAAALSPATANGRFIRGDTNADGTVNLADAIYLLGHLFPATGTPNLLKCLDAADANDDQGLNVADTITLLNSLFGVPAVPLPIPNVVSGCGTDSNGSLGCVISTPSC